MWKLDVDDLAILCMGGICAKAGVEIKLDEDLRNQPLDDLFDDIKKSMEDHGEDLSLYER